jgi:hypothetical protein
VRWEVGGWDDGTVRPSRDAAPSASACSTLGCEERAALNVW